MNYRKKKMTKTMKKMNQKKSKEEKKKEKKKCPISRFLPSLTRFLDLVWDKGLRGALWTF